MKTYLLLFSFLTIAFASKAQTDVIDTIPAYQKTNTLPDVDVVKTDGSWYNIYKNNKNNPTAIIVFNPDCHHCELEAEDIAQNIDAVKHINFLWITTSGDKNATLAFSQKFGFYKHSNFLFLYDPNFKIPVFYEVRTTPFIAVYDNAGKMKQIFRQGAKTENILAALEQK